MYVLCRTIKTVAVCFARWHPHYVPNCHTPPYMQVIQLPHACTQNNDVATSPQPPSKLIELKIKIKQLDRGEQVPTLLSVLA